MLGRAEDDPSVLSELDSTLAGLEESVGVLEDVSPETLVQPFIAKTESVSGLSISYTAYYTPAVVVVLLQHVVLTFAALSMVSERNAGTTELFRAAPLTSTEMLAGKFLGYSVLGSIVGVVLILGIVFAFGAPMVGSWGWLAVVMAPGDGFFPRSGFRAGGGCLERRSSGPVGDAGPPLHDLLQRLRDSHQPPGPWCSPGRLHSSRHSRDRHPPGGHVQGQPAVAGTDRPVGPLRDLGDDYRRSDPQTPASGVTPGSRKPHDKRGGFDLPLLYLFPR